MYLNLLNVLGEDTHSGWTTKGIGRVNSPPLTTKQKTIFSINPAFLAQKFEEKKL